MSLVADPIEPGCNPGGLVVHEYVDGERSTTRMVADPVWATYAATMARGRAGALVEAGHHVEQVIYDGDDGGIVAVVVVMPGAKT